MHEITSQSSVRSSGADGVRIRLSWALAVIVIGARLWVFDYAGSPLPYFDQWVMEFNNEFLRIFNGDAWWSILFARHNEHLLVTTRVFSIFGFVLNGYWDVKFLVMISAIVRAAEAALAFWLLADGRRPAGRILVWLSCVLIFAAPISAFNFLCGMQMSFFLADIAMLWAVWAVLRWRSAGWGIMQIGLSSLVGLTSMGSAIAIPGSILAVHLLQRRARGGFWIAWGLSMLLVAGFILSATLGSSPSRPLSLEQLQFFFRLLSWPVLNVGLSFILVAGAVVWMWRAMRIRGCNDYGLLAGAGLAVFAAVNMALLAINRMPEEFHSRHWDTVSLGTLGVVSVVVGLSERAPRLRWWAKCGTGALLILYVTGFAFQIRRVSLPYINEALVHRQANIDYYQALFLSGEIQKTGDRIQNQLEARDFRFFDDPIDRYVPHPRVIGNIMSHPLPALALLSPDMFPVRQRSLMDETARRVIRFGWLLLPAGIFLGLWSILAPRYLNRPILRSDPSR